MCMLTYENVYIYMCVYTYGCIPVRERYHAEILRWNSLIKLCRFHRRVLCTMPFSIARIHSSHSACKFEDREEEEDEKGGRAKHTQNVIGRKHWVCGYTHKYLHTHIHVRTHMHTHTHAHAHTLSHTHTLSLFLSHTQREIMLFIEKPMGRSIMISNTHTCTLSHTHTRAHAHTHPHTHTH